MKQQTSLLVYLLVYFVSAQLLSLPANLPENGRLNFTQLAAKYGHPAEPYHVTTEDGYILTLFRLPGNKSQPVLLQHGIFGSSDDYILRGKKSLGIILADRGYDVWLGNSRGNRYSRHHMTLNPDTDTQFFDYSFDDFGYYDTPAFIDLILKETGQNKLSAIGHSEGNTMYFVLGARRPEYNKKIKVFVALAPVCFFDNVEAPLSTLISISPYLHAVAQALNQVEIIGENSITRQVIKSFCSLPIIGYEICFNVLGFSLTGYDPDQLEPEFIPTFIGHYPSESSLKNLYHYAQLGLRKKFARYDYGIAKNLLTYGSASPPEYNLSKVKMNVVLEVGKNDKVTLQADMEKLNRTLPNVVDYHVIEHPLFNHFDFIVGRDSDKYLYLRLVSIIETYN